MTGSQIFGTLKDLAGKAGQAVHERLKLCSELIADKAYVASEFGDEGKALDKLEADCFGDLAGARGLAELLAMYRKFPEPEAWKRHKWNLSRLLAEWDVARKEQRIEGGEPRTRTAVKMAEYQEVKDELAKKEVQFTATISDRDLLRKENAELRARIVELERENLGLSARVDELQRMVNGRRRQMVGAN